MNQNVIDEIRDKHNIIMSGRQPFPLGIVSKKNDGKFEIFKRTFMAAHRSRARLVGTITLDIWEMRECGIRAQ